MVQLPEVHPRTVRPTERPARAQNPDAQSRRARDNAVRLRHVEPACVPLRHAARAHHNFVTHCIGWRKNNRADHPISYLDTLIKTGSESIEATMRRRPILFAGFVVRMEDTRLPKCVRSVRRSGGGRGLCGGPGKIMDGMFPERPQSFWHQRRLVDDCSLGRGEMTPDGGTRGGTFQGEINRCRES